MSLEDHARLLERWLFHEQRGVLTQEEDRELRRRVQERLETFVPPERAPGGFHKLVSYWTQWAYRRRVKDGVPRETVMEEFDEFARQMQSMVLQHDRQGKQQQSRFDYPSWMPYVFSMVKEDLRRWYDQELSRWIVAHRNTLPVALTDDPLRWWRWTSSLWDNFDAFLEGCFLTMKYAERDVRRAPFLWAERLVGAVLRGLGLERLGLGFRGLGLGFGSRGFPFDFTTGLGAERSLWWYGGGLEAFVKGTVEWMARTSVEVFQELQRRGWWEMPVIRYKDDGLPPLPQAPLRTAACRFPPKTLRQRMKWLAGRCDRWSLSLGQVTSSTSDERLVSLRPAHRPGGYVDLELQVGLYRHPEEALSRMKHEYSELIQEMEELYEARMLWRSLPPREKKELQLRLKLRQVFKTDDVSMDVRAIPQSISIMAPPKSANNATNRQLALLVNQTGIEPERFLDALAAHATLRMPRRDLPASGFRSDVSRYESENLIALMKELNLFVPGTASNAVQQIEDWTSSFQQFKQLMEDNPEVCSHPLFASYYASAVDAVQADASSNDHDRENQALSLVHQWISSMIRPSERDSLISGLEKHKDDLVRLMQGLSKEDRRQLIQCLSSESLRRASPSSLLLKSVLQSIQAQMTGPTTQKEFKKTTASKALDALDKWEQYQFRHLFRVVGDRDSHSKESLAAYPPALIRRDIYEWYFSSPTAAGLYFQNINCGSGSSGRKKIVTTTQRARRERLRKEQRESHLRKRGSSSLNEGHPYHEMRRRVLSSFLENPTVPLRDLQPSWDLERDRYVDAMHLLAPSAGKDALPVHSRREWMFTRSAAPKG